MTTPTYLLAKYIPDLKRLEPRNVGVILWTTLGVAARFLFERPSVLGEVDGRSVPNWISNLEAYKQWVAYWRRSVSGATYEPPNGGSPVAVTSPQFVKAIQSSSNGNFVLVEGGVLLDDVPEDEIEGACAHLFDTLVKERTIDGPRDLNLDEQWEEVISQANLKNSRFYHRGFRMPLGEETFVFSDALANGAPKRLYERVPLAKRPATFMKNAHHAAWQFEKVVQAGTIGIADTAAIVSLTEEQEQQHRGHIASLSSVTRVLNLRRQGELASEVEQLTHLVFEETQRSEESNQGPIKTDLW